MSMIFVRVHIATTTKSTKFHPIPIKQNIKKFKNVNFFGQFWLNRPEYSNKLKQNINVR